MINDTDFKNKFNNILATGDDADDIALSLYKLGKAIHESFLNPSIHEYSDGTWAIRIRRRSLENAGMSKNHMLIIDIYQLNPENGELLVWYKWRNEHSEGE